MSFTDYLEGKVLDHILKIATFTVPTNLYVAVSTADPGEDGLGIIEPIGNGYARTICNSWTSNGIGSRRNNLDITFPPATGAWGHLTHFAIFDALTAGNCLIKGALQDPVDIALNETPRFPIGVIIVNLN